MLGGASFVLAMIAMSLRAEEARAQPYLVKDIKPAGDANPIGLTPLGGSLLFFADDGVVGTELWKTDGTAAGTALVKDIVPGAASSVYTVAPVALGGSIYFFSGATFWKSDGTSGGTSQLAAVAGTTVPVVAGANVFFGGYTSGTGYELWKSDGTGPGTALVKDIYPGVIGSMSSLAPVSIGASVVFVADDGTHGQEPWVSDGTPAGTTLLADVKPGSSDSRIQALVSAGNVVYFAADDGTHGQEVWKTDGTPAGTVMVADLEPGSTSSYPTLFGASAGKVFFSASAAQIGLYVTDGTALGTVYVTNAVYPLAGTDVNGVFFLEGNDASHGYELWRSDGTAGGTVLVKDIHPGSASGVLPGVYPQCTMRALGSTLYFCADDGTTGYEPWKSDGTGAGTVPLEISPRGNSEPGEIVTVGSAVYIAATNGVVGRELWVSGGGIANDAGVPAAIGPTPYLVKDIKPGAVDSSPFHFVDVGGTLVFFADDGVNGVEPWRSDGTTLGTSMLKDIHTGALGSYQIGAARPALLGGSAYFPALSGTDNGLWKTDGTSAGTVEVKSALVATSLTPVGTSLLMWGWTASPTYQLWKSDGTTAGTVLVKDVQPGTQFGLPVDGSIVAAGGKAFFPGHDATNGNELWVSDGTAMGTSIVKNVNAGSADATPSLLTPAGAKVFFVANDGTTDDELWVSDGTDGGTLRLTSSTPSYLAPSALTALGTSVYFIGEPDGLTYGLWTSDGTVMGTTLVKALSILDLASSNGALYFFASDPATGYELWKSDGTTGGTALLKDIRPGPASSYGQYMPDGPCPAPHAVGSLLVFCADDGTRGYELWQSDGTAAGTVPMEISSHGNAFAGEVIQSGSHLFFAASDGPSGVELFALGGSGPGPGGDDGGASSSSSGGSSSGGASSGGASSGGASSSSGASGGDAPGAGGGGDSGGCGCVIAGDSTWWGAPAFFALGLAALLRRKRQAER